MLMKSLARVHQNPIQEHLANLLTLQEVQAAIKAVNSNKAPGSDGIPADIWKTSKILAERPRSLLTHIQEKKDDPKQFRMPIS